MSHRALLLALLTLAACRHDKIDLGDDTGDADPDSEGPGTIDTDDTDDTDEPAPPAASCDDHVALVGTDGYDSVQAAVSAATAATDGDTMGTVVVCSGIHTVANLTVDGRDLRIEGNEDSPDDHVLDAEGAGRILAFSNGTLELVGLTLRGGVAVDGGALHLTDATASIENSVVDGNLADESGAGIYAERVDLALDGTVVQGNDCNWRGGGLSHRDGILTVSDSTFSVNGASSGAGIWLGHEAPTGLHATITDSHFEDNLARYGGAISIDPDAPTDALSQVWLVVNDTDMVGNRADLGGALAMRGDGHGDIWSDGGLSITDGEAWTYGGGLFLDARFVHTVTLQNAHFGGNEAYRGGAVTLRGTHGGWGTFTAIGTTFTANEAEAGGGAILLEADGIGMEETEPLYALLSECTVTSNQTLTGGGGAEVGLSGFLESIDSEWGQTSGQHNAPYDIVTVGPRIGWNVAAGDDWFACDVSTCSL